MTNTILETIILAPLVMVGAVILAKILFILGGDKRD